MKIISDLLLVVAVLQLAQTATAQTVQCGTTENAFSRAAIGRHGMKIIRGRPASIYNWPWIVEICIYNQYSGTCRFQCGGSVIDNEWVLSAAHCFENERVKYAVKLGSENRYVAESGEVVRLVQQVYKHPYFNQGAQYANDMALLKLERPVEYSSRIRPICLSTSESGVVYPGKPAAIAGWGTTGTRSPSSLLESTIDLVADETCKRIFPYSFDQGTMMCAYRYGTDTCQGDSGGPLAVQHDRNSRWYLAGVVSWGYGCAKPNTPGVYARVSVQCSFIQQTTGKNICISS